jgi:putative transposase
VRTNIKGGCTMFKTSSENLPEVQEIFKEKIEQPEKMFEMMRIDMKDMCEKVVIDLLKVELSYFLGRNSYERTAGEKNYRNGSYKRSYTVKNI